MSATIILLWPLGLREICRRVLPRVLGNAAARATPELLESVFNDKRVKADIDSRTASR